MSNPTASIPFAAQPCEDTLPQSRRPLVPMVVRGVNDVSLHVHGYRPRVCAPSTTTSAARNIVIPNGSFATVWRGYLQRTEAARLVTVLVSCLTEGDVLAPMQHANTLWCRAVFSEFDGTSADSHDDNQRGLPVTDPYDIGGVTEDMLLDTLRPIRAHGEWCGTPILFAFTFTPDAGLTVASTRLDLSLYQVGNLTRLCGITVQEQIKVSL